MSTPAPPRAAISKQELVSPAAPMSWTPSTTPLLIASRLASSRTFSVKGSPTCTVGLFASLSASKASDAIVAP